MNAAKRVELTPITGSPITVEWTEVTREAQHALGDVVGKTKPG